MALSRPFLNGTILFSLISPEHERGLKEELFGCFKYIKIPFDKVLRKIGDGFSLNTSTGVITASENVKNVKISIGVRINNNISGNLYPRIYSQSGISDFTESGGKSSSQIKNETIDKCDTSKIIQGGFRCSATGEVILMGTEQYTYMLVEEL